MKKILKHLFIVMMAISMIVPMNMSQANAASKTYEITFKAGSKGKFDVSDLKGNYTVNDDQTSITYKVEAKGTFPDVPTVIVEEGYRNNKWSQELPAVGSKVEEKQVYVAKYTKLVNAVEFTVKYVDTNGVEIATPTIYTTDLNTEEVVRAKTIEGYQADALQKRLVVSREEVEIQFVYTSLEEATQPPVIEQIVEVEGEPVYRDVIVGTGANQDANANQDQEDNPDVNINENDVPQAGGDEDDEQTGGETTDIEENNVPQAGTDETSNMMYIAGGVGIFAIIVLVAYVLSKRKKQEN